MLQSTSVDLYDLLRDVPAKDVVFIGILTNGVFFAQRMQQKLKQLSYDVECPVMELDISLYRDDIASQKNYMTVI